MWNWFMWNHINLELDPNLTEWIWNQARHRSRVPKTFPWTNKRTGQKLKLRSDTCISYQRHKKDPYLGPGTIKKWVKILDSCPTFSGRVLVGYLGTFSYVTIMSTQTTFWSCNSKLSLPKGILLTSWMAKSITGSSQREREFQKSCFVSLWSLISPCGGQIQSIKLIQIQQSWLFFPFADQQIHETEFEPWPSK